MRSWAIRALVVAGVVGWHLAGVHPKPTPAVAANSVTSVSDDANAGPHGGSVVLNAGWNGHYFADGDVAGKSLRFMVDTGASTVALSRDQAKAVGVDVDHLAFDRQMETAGGIVSGALVTLPRLRIGDIQLLDVPAVVIDRPSEIALLGQSFLGRLDKVSIEGANMTLTKN